MSWWRRRDPARDEHASSRVDLIALWGPDDEPIGDDAPGLDEDVVPDEERAVDDNVAVDDEVMLNDESALDDVAAVDDEPATAAPDDPLGTIDAPDDALGTIDAPDYAVESVDAPDHAPAASARLGASDDLLDAPPAAAPSAFAPPVPPAPVRERPPGGGRAVRVLLIGAVIAGGLLVDQAIGHGSAPAAHAAAPPAPTMAPAGALSSTWLCPALGASAASPVLGSLVVGNPGGAPVTATATIVPGSGAPVVQHVALAPYTKQVIALDAAAPGDYAAATVTFDGAAGAVEQRVHGPFGDSVAPCASATSDHWYFPTGETDAGATEYLSLYNPFPSAAIADLSFETDQGLAVPDAFQGVVVPANGFTVLDIGARVRSRTSVATIVSVRGGRVVADELQSLSAGARGLVLTLGAPAPGTSWFYANGGIGPGVRERFDVFNPGT
ncbi:MAG TPA: DUF5719 family protein, partial [Acidimicrobiales bacterium]|nr:DUF5719 family protein [Acidimicrobiales bacterium]